VQRLKYCPAVGISSFLMYPHSWIEWAETEQSITESTYQGPDTPTDRHQRTRWRWLMSPGKGCTCTHRKDYGWRWNAHTFCAGVRSYSLAHQLGCAAVHCSLLFSHPTPPERPLTKPRLVQSHTKNFSHRHSVDGPTLRDFKRRELQWISSEPMLCYICMTLSYDA